MIGHSQPDRKITKNTHKAWKFTSPHMPLHRKKHYQVGWKSWGFANYKLISFPTLHAKPQHKFCTLSPSNLQIVTFTKTHVINGQKQLKYGQELPG